MKKGENTMNKTVLRRYAKLIAQVGVNVQKDQEVIVYAELDQPEFVKMVVEECYKCGAKKVRVDWGYQPLQKLHAEYQEEKVLGKVETWEKARLRHMVDVLPARIYLMSEDPDGLNGIAQPKYSNALRKRSKVTKPYRDAIDNKHQWCIAAVPGADWAKKVFPGLRKNQAVEKLWESILFTSRALDDPIKAWEAHNADLKARCAYLNSKNIRTLEYKASNGTDLKVGLIEDSDFLAGQDVTLSGVTYNPNIPSEEAFISPKRGEAEGIVYSTKPLSFMGQLIENFSVRFENGKAVEVKAEKNEELLKQIISMDENAPYLGECALVPKNSPISESGITFFNTLFDENAACHLALGAGFDNCLRGYESLTKQQCIEKGVNDSVIHEDFMIGCDDLEITGVTASGERVPIFKDGTWAF